MVLNINTINPPENLGKTRYSSNSRKQIRVVLWVELCSAKIYVDAVTPGTCKYDRVWK